MARSFGKVYTSIWSDPSWRAVTPNAKLVYLMLLSQPKLSICGCIDMKPQIWAVMTGLDRGALDDAIRELCRDDFLAVDDTTEELVIRTLVTHDGGTKNPRTLTAVWNAIQRIESEPLQTLVIGNLPPDAFGERFGERFGESSSKVRGTVHGTFPERFGDTFHPSPSPSPSPSRVTSSSTTSDAWSGEVAEDPGTDDRGSVLWAKRLRGAVGRHVNLTDEQIESELLTALLDHPDLSDDELVARIEARRPK